MRNRIKDALILKEMKQVELCEKTGISKTSINGWVKNNWQPKKDALYKMAKALDVNELWLAGYDVPLTKFNISPSGNNQNLTVVTDMESGCIDYIILSKYTTSEKIEELMRNKPDIPFDKLMLIDYLPKDCIVYSGFLKDFTRVYY